MLANLLLLNLDIRKKHISLIIKNQSASSFSVEAFFPTFCVKLM